MIQDLVTANQDRYVGYSTFAKYVDESKEENLLALIEQAMQQSQQYKTQLIPFVVPQENEKPHSPMENHISWPIQQPTGPVGQGHINLLTACISAEEETLALYERTLTKSQALEHSLLRMIDSQREGLVETIGKLQQLRIELSKGVSG